MTMAVECGGEMIVFGRQEVVKGSTRKTHTISKRGEGIGVYYEDR